MSGRNQPRPAPNSTARSPLLIGIAVLLAAAGGLHLAALPGHLGSSLAAGVFFAATAIGQLVGAVLIATRPSRRITVAVMAGNLAVLAIWALSRTAGLPIGGEVGAPEPLGVLDGLAAAAQVLVVAGGLRTIVGRVPVNLRRRAGWQPALALGVAWLVAGGVGTSLAEPAHHHHSDQTADVHPALVLDPAATTFELPAAPAPPVPAGDGRTVGGHSHAGQCDGPQTCGADHRHHG